MRTVVCVCDECGEKVKDETELFVVSVQSVALSKMDLGEVCKDCYNKINLKAVAEKQL